MTIPIIDTKRKVALYCRVSSGRQTTENQKLILEEHAKKQGWEYYLYEEKESTRKTRPIKAMLLSKLRNNEYDAVCVLKLDRWARSNIELAGEIVELKQKRGVDFISIRDNIDLTTASGMLQFHIICAFAEFERSIISERTRDGLARKKAEGVQLGRRAGSKDKKRRKRSGYHLRHASAKMKKKYGDGIG